MARLIFELGIGSVQRPDDWTRFRWNDFDGTGLRVVQQKTGRELCIPCTGFVIEALGTAPKKGLTVLTKQDGTPLPYRCMRFAIVASMNWLCTAARMTKSPAIQATPPRQ
jgi:integrase